MQTAEICISDPSMDGRDATRISQKQSRRLKQFLMDVAYFYDLPRWANEILFELLMEMDADGEVVISMGVKKRIASELRISVPSIKNAISIYAKKDILIRQQTGVYQFNSQIFGKRQWQYIRDIRMGVNYDTNGIRQLQIEVEYYN
ncbi:hypothetical protein QNI19_09240 [Cytophagaceae bacterium DM2B3-1]|uniref:Plasmid replication protein RepL domain-containing protein n=1 Tax=Xanthocytophaga flava TaxID=3048013 RepID=A0ABT7CHV5_9BACT|nr:hypothetical protein [Xanthocytophaga flavus]MDJ1493116.1 hypothetical protein [Xanthocytophaga flavus]